MICEMRLPRLFTLACDCYSINRCIIQYCMIIAVTQDLYTFTGSTVQSVSMSQQSLSDRLYCIVVSSLLQTLLIIAESSLFKNKLCGLFGTKIFSATRCDSSMPIYPTPILLINYRHHVHSSVTCRRRNYALIDG
jgi:hypothetical protein